jgi:ribose 5-phosphate isomerase RpiB
MQLVVGGDHAGFVLKGPVVATLRDWGHTVNDIGTHTSEPVDFPDIARELCAEVTQGRAERGVSPSSPSWSNGTRQRLISECEKARRSGP